MCEVSPESLAVLEEITERVSNNGGAALVADYGELTNRNEFTLRVRVWHQIPRESVRF